MKIKSKKTTIMMKPKRPPFKGAVGRWTLPKYVPPDRNYFGKFSCRKCNNRWLSAFSYSNHQQRCEKCLECSKCSSTWYSPTWLFVFKKKGKRSNNNNKKGQRKAHPSQSCGACIAGKCLNAKLLRS